MLDLHRLLVVTRFELRDALRSRLVIVVALFFAAGAAIGSLGFIRSLEAAELAARDLLVQQSGLPAEAIPLAQIRTQALEMVISMVRDPELRDVLLGMQPLSIFFGYMAQSLTPLLVLVLSAGAHSADVQSGATRFILFRCGRSTWAWGKLLAHAALLGLGLSLAALVSGLCGLHAQSDFPPQGFIHLGLGALRAFLFGLPYLGVFCGISLLLRETMPARVLCLVALMAAGMGHFISSTSWFSGKFGSAFQWLFPAHYERMLWLSSPPPVLLAVSVLLLLFGLAFSGAVLRFSQRDA